MPAAAQRLSEDQPPRRSSMLNRLYEWALSLAGKPQAIWVMAAISFADSSFLPLPPDFLLVPMVIAKPRRAVFYATVCTVASVIGAALGYAIGALLWDTVGQWLIKLYGYQDKVDYFRQLYAQYGAWVILIKGFTPIPYKLVTIVSGFAGYDFAAFMGLSLLTRGARFFVLSLLLNRYRDQVHYALDRYLPLILSASLVLLAGGVALSLYLF
jgi:membrane protein YqaA with SNARE-associated domain